MFSPCWVFCSCTTAHLAREIASRCGVPSHAPAECRNLRILNAKTLTTELGAPRSHMSKQQKKIKKPPPPSLSLPLEIRQKASEPPQLLPRICVCVRARHGPMRRFSRRRGFEARDGALTGRQTRTVPSALPDARYGSCGWHSTQ